MSLVRLGSAAKLQRFVYINRVPVFAKQDVTAVHVFANGLRREFWHENRKLTYFPQINCGFAIQYRSQQSQNQVKGTTLGKNCEHGTYLLLCHLELSGSK